MSEHQHVHYHEGNEDRGITIVNNNNNNNCNNRYYGGHSRRSKGSVFYAMAFVAFLIMGVKIGWGLSFAISFGACFLWEAFLRRVWLAVAPILLVIGIIALFSVIL
jgi:hypothetical protein